MSLAIQWIYSFAALFWGTLYYARNMRHTGLWGPGAIGAWIQKAFGLIDAPRGREGTIVWLHVSGPGDARAAEILLHELRAELSGLPLMITVTTRFAKTRLTQSKETRGVTIYWIPFDFPWIWDRVLRRLRPMLFIGMQGEFWPNLIRKLHDRGIESVFLRVDMFDWNDQHEFPPWLFPLYARMLGYVKWYSVRHSIHRRRIERLGIRGDHITVAGDYGMTPPLLQEMRHTNNPLETWVAPHARPLVVFAARRFDEARAILARLIDAPTWGGYHLVVAPVELDLVRRIERYLRQRGIRTTRRSRNERDEMAVRILDSQGELLWAYKLSCAAIVGDTFPPTFSTGANYWEPLLLGIPILHGPALILPARVDENAGAAYECAHYSELPGRLHTLLGRRASRSLVMRVARDAMERSARGALKDSELIRTLLKPAGSRINL